MTSPLPEPVREALDYARPLIGSLQSMRDRLAPFLAEHFGEAFDGDMDTLQEAIAHIKRAGDDLALLRGQKKGWQVRCDAWQEQAEKAEAERDALAQRCAAAERGVQAARSLCESWHAEARAEGYGGGNTRAHLILAAIDAAIHQETP